GPTTHASSTGRQYHSKSRHRYNPPSSCNYRRLLRLPPSVARTTPQHDPSALAVLSGQFPVNSATPAVLLLGPHPSTFSEPINLAVSVSIPPPQGHQPNFTSPVTVGELGDR
ncbi:hypothetical protein H4R33_005885, partial [Dimargaris cristalligena]